jgi:hypothetical protein
MSLFRKSFIYGVALIAAVFVFWGCQQPTDSPTDITWTAEADGDGTAASTKIDFTFARAVSGLTAEQITVINDTGSVTKGELTGGGTEWSLGITVETEGDIAVRIDRDGVDSGEQAVTVHKAPVAAWTAVADGADGVTTSTVINFTFDKAVVGLTADDITVTENTGRVARGDLTGSGTNWALGIVVETAGDVAVVISKDGITTATKNVAVYKAGEITALTWSAQADGGGGVFTSTYIGFTFSGTVTDLTAEHITITGDTGSVTKGALTLDGTEWKLGITVGSAGDVIVAIDKDGIETTARKVAVHKSGEMAIYSWVAQANGAADTTDTTAIVFTFSGAIADLSANTIALTNNTGAVTKGEVTGSGTSWSLGVTVNTAGNIKVKINSGGIEDVERTVAVHKVPAPSDITYDIAADGGASTTSTKIDFTFDAAVVGLTADHITLANGTGAATKGALAGSGENWSLAITVTTAGNVKVAINKNGIEAAEKTVAVHKAAPPVEDEDIVYDVAADGGASTTSTKINFTFDKAVTGLTAEQITLVNDTGAATKGALTGSGTSWSLGITVNTAGNVKVTISKAGIEDAEKTVAVYKFVPPPDTAYTAVADGAANTTTSAKIDLIFNATVSGLTAGDISVVNDTGVVAKGTLAGSGTDWSLGITVATAGNVKVKINKTGIEAAEKTVTVYKALPPPDITYTAAANGVADTTDSTAIVFAFGSAVTGLTAEQITVTDGTGAVTKGTVSGNGTNWSLVIAVATAGNVKVKINKQGIEAAEKNVAVHKAPVVNDDLTYSVLADGGETASSTKIDFTFAGAVEGLTGEQITLTDDIGAVTKGALTGSGINWSLGITVATAGNVKVKINKAGIEAAEKNVAVYKFVPPPSITYTATADGNATTSSTKIDFVFGSAVAGLSAGDISVVTDTGAAAKGALTGSGINWSLGITVTTAGNVKVKINKAGIEAAEKTVAVHKALPITYTATANGEANATDSNAIVFAFGSAVAGLTAEQIIVTNDTGAVTTGAVSGSSTSWTLGIGVATAGNVQVKINKAGIETGEKTVAVHKAPVVNNDISYGALADGGVTATSTKINFAFSDAVAELTANDIIITSDTGNVAKGSLTGSGASRALGITVNTAGNVKIKINKAGIEAAEKTVAVYKAGQITDISWTAQVDGAAGTTNSSYIDFTFSDGVTDLTAGDITLDDDVGSADKGTLTGNGTAWRLGIAVVVAGDVKVSINKPGIENTLRKVMVHKTGENPLVSWEVEVDGEEGARDSTAIAFTFSGAVAGLNANNVAITSGGGSVTRGAMTGNGRNWTLGITVNAPGNLTVRIINTEGIATADRTITVHKAPDVLYNATADGSATATSTAITFTFESAVTGLTADNITLTDDAGSVVKGNLSGNGTSWTLGITVNTAGDVKASIDKAGIEAAEKTVAVYKAALPNNDITYSAAAAGHNATTSSTAINFTFSRAVTDLTADNITVAGVTGSVTKGALTGSGAARSLAITVSAAGDVLVSIDKTGIDAAEKTVAVQKFVPAGYTAAADGNAATNSTKIDLVFDKEVTGLTAAQIALTNDTGTATKGNLSGSGTAWSLGITVAAAGNVKLKINNPGIDAAEKTVAVNRAPDIAYTATADGGATATSTKIDFVFGRAVTDLTAAQIAVVNGTGRVTTGALTGSGTAWSLALTGVAAAGNVTVRINKAGVEAAERTVAVVLFIPVAYTAAANGAGNTTTSDAITFTFDRAVTGLTADQITITNGTGEATKGALTGDGTSWSLAITVAKPGSVTVAIKKAEIETEEKSLTVHGAPGVGGDIAYTATTDGNARATSTRLRFNFASDVAGLVVGDITVADGTGKVTTGALTGSGTSWSLAIASVDTVGNVKVTIAKTGIAAAEKIVDVFSVIGYTVTADGVYNTTASEALTFVFDASVDSLNLTADDISITNGTGTAVKGSLNGSGTNWTLGIGVTATGNVSVRINKDGIEGAAKTAAVYAIGYTAAADGDADTTSTKIDFTFAGSGVTGLTADEITITNGTGSAVKGELSGSGTAWSLEITDVGVTGLGATAGTVKVRINKTGIEGAEREVTVNKPLDLTDAVELGQTSGSNDVNIGFPEENGAETTIAIDATEKGEVYFLATKTPAQTIAPSWVDADSVTVHTSGEVDGETASGAVAVIGVKTGILPFEGGIKTFSLIVNENGKLSRTITVNLEIKTLKTGSAVFKVLRPAGQTYADGDDNAVLVRVGAPTTLRQAITWVENNAEANTEYLVRVESDVGLYRYMLAFHNVENVTLRLKGSKNDTTDDGETWTRTLKHDGSSYVINEGSRADQNAFFQIGGGNSYGGNPVNYKRTFILDSNITLEGVGGTIQSTQYRGLIRVGINATLVLRPGAVITKHVRTTKSSGGSVITVESTPMYNPNRDPELNGRLRLEGGSITNCRVDNVIPEPNLMSYITSNLISFIGREDNYALGSFYKAVGVVFSGNVNLQEEDANEVTFNSEQAYTNPENSRIDYTITDEEMSLPAQ